MWFASVIENLTLVLQPHPREFSRAKNTSQVTPSMRGNLGIMLRVIVISELAHNNTNITVSPKQASSVGLPVLDTRASVSSNFLICIHCSRLC